MASERFARDQRLTTAPEYQRVLGGAQRRTTRYFTLLFLENELPHARLGLIVAKRQLPRAVARNRFRRLARESFRRHQEQLSGLDVIVIARAAAATLTNTALLAQLDSNWPTAQRPCEPSSSG